MSGTIPFPFFMGQSQVLSFQKLFWMVPSRFLSLLLNLLIQQITLFLWVLRQLVLQQFAVGLSTLRRSEQVSHRLVLVYTSRIQRIALVPVAEITQDLQIIS